MALHSKFFCERNWKKSVLLGTVYHIPWGKLNTYLCLKRVNEQLSNSTLVELIVQLQLLVQLLALNYCPKQFSKKPVTPQHEIIPYIQLCQHQSNHYNSILQHFLSYLQGNLHCLMWSLCTSSIPVSVQAGCGGRPLYCQAKLFLSYELSLMSSYNLNFPFNIQSQNYTANLILLLI